MDNAPMAAEISNFDGLESRILQQIYNYEYKLLHYADIDKYEKCVETQHKIDSLKKQYVDAALKYKDWTYHMTGVYKALGYKPGIYRGETNGDRKRT